MIKLPGWSNLPLFRKVQYYCASLTPEYAQYVDKLSAKQLARAVIPDENRLRIPKVVRVLQSPEDLSVEDLIPGKVVIKATHGCGWNIFVTDWDTVDGCRQRLRGWNRVYNDGKEVQYRYVQKRFFIEERLSQPFLNVKVRCIHGRAIPFITVTDGSGGLGRGTNFYDFEWNPLRPLEIGKPIPKPRKLDEIVKMAEELSAPFEFVRIDFYVDTDENENENVWFSEYTFTPSAGAQILSMEQEMRFGRLWL